MEKGKILAICEVFPGDCAQECKAVQHGWKSRCRRLRFAKFCSNDSMFKQVDAVIVTSRRHICSRPEAAAIAVLSGTCNHF